MLNGSDCMKTIRLSPYLQSIYGKKYVSVSNKKHHFLKADADKDRINICEAWDKDQGKLRRGTHVKSVVKHSEKTIESFPKAFDYEAFEKQGVDCRFGSYIPEKLKVACLCPYPSVKKLKLTRKGLVDPWICEAHFNSKFFQDTLAFVDKKQAEREKPPQQAGYYCSIKKQHFLRLLELPCIQHIDFICSDTKCSKGIEKLFIKS